ncbi:MAG: extracellular solute-binding protein [Lachnospiraceae bacterium]|nr:extracellular solute-binding protein [Lachnospiraceae bacterium]
MKKIISALMCIVLFMGVITMSGCGGSNKEGTNSGDITEKEMYVYNEFELNSENGEVYKSYLNGSDLYYIAYSYPETDMADEESYDEEWVREHDKGQLRQYKTDSGEDIMLCDIQNPTSIVEFFVTKQNQIKVLYSESIEGRVSDIMVTKMMDGTDVSTISFTDKMTTAFGEGFQIERTRIGQDDEVYVSCKKEEGHETYIARCDSDCNVNASVKFENRYVDGMFFDNENQLAVETNGSDGLAYTYIDFEKGVCGETVIINDLEGEYKFSADEHGGGVTSKIYNGRGDVTCYIKDTAGLCAYNAKEQSVTFLFDWTNTGMIGSFVDKIIPLEDGRLFCECLDRGLINLKFGILDKLKEGTGRKVITCAVLNTEDDYRHTMEQNVINYNKSNADYRVELVSYDKSTNPIDTFAKDVIAGNIPDVLDISGVDVKNYINKGFFEDLAPYMEKDDVFSKDYYIDGLYDAIAVDGKQYYAIKNFRLDTIVAKESDTEKYKDGWTIHDMIEYYNSKPEGTIFHIMNSRDELFRILVEPFIDDYIDWENGTVGFDSDEFREMAGFLGKFSSNYEEWYDYGEVNKQIHEGKILINNTMISSELDDLSMNMALFDNDIRFIGYPSTDKKKACVIPLSSSLAITSSSKEKDAAWDFVKSVITDYSDNEIQYFDTGIPSGKKQFDKLAKRLTATEKYTEEDGTVVKPFKGTGSMNGFEYSVGMYSEDVIQLIRELIKSSVIKTDNSGVLLIVESGLNDYFEGRKTLDELISVLQDRVGKYVNENR